MYLELKVQKQWDIDPWGFTEFSWLVRNVDSSWVLFQDARGAWRGADVRSELLIFYISSWNDVLSLQDLHTIKIRKENFQVRMACRTHMLPSPSREKIWLDFGKRNVLKLHKPWSLRKWRRWNKKIVENRKQMEDLAESELAVGKVDDSPASQPQTPLKGSARQVSVLLITEGWLKISWRRIQVPSFIFYMQPGFQPLSTQVEDWRLF